MSYTLDWLILALLALLFTIVVLLVEIESKCEKDRTKRSPRCIIELNVNERYPRSYDSGINVI